MSIQSQVTQKYKELNNPTLKEMRECLPDINPIAIKTCYYRAKKVSNKSETNDTRITMDMVEKLIIKGKTSVPILRVMTDFLKVKSQDHSELQEIDMTLFYKKAMED